MNKKYDLIVVGGGILGTFHAYHAIKKGLKVALIEKNKTPQGATVRNFGQVVPSGMNTKWQGYGRESLKIYKEIQSNFNISAREEGTVYLASNEEEVQLLEELKTINKNNGYASQLLTKEECLKAYPGLQENYVTAGLRFSEEINIEPLTMINKLHAYLKNLGLHLFTGKEVVECHTIQDSAIVYTSDECTYTTSKVIICNGSDFKTLYPRLFKESDLIISKLQMMSTQPQENYRLKGSILTGLSIRRYEAFQECPSYETIKSKENVDALENKWGVHILFKQAMNGAVILGDSHEYASVSKMDNLGFDLNMDIDNFIIKEAKKIIALPNYKIQHRWYGIYSQCKNSDIFQHTIHKHVHIVTGIGGKGMTGSAGFAKENINKIFNF